MASSHVRIGRIQEEINIILREAEEADRFRSKYAAEGDEAKKIYWEARYECCTSIANRLLVNFNIIT
ncbi:hypothetical protein ACK8P5_00865 [Paenibacillus sp. EC2-1]|uniref:hypothetical protein n=1 Tax=Paenibacillus sp. EC2-1 TaxID=3388665 RepID=UPI003BEEDAD2